MYPISSVAYWSPQKAKRNLAKKKKPGQDEKIHSIRAFLIQILLEIGGIFAKKNRVV